MTALSFVWVYPYSKKIADVTVSIGPVKDPIFPCVILCRGKKTMFG